MRLRFLWTDYYQEASEAAQLWHRRNVLPIPPLQDCVFSSFPCTVSVSAQIRSQLLEGKLHIVCTDPSRRHHLDIQRVQSQFLSAILPQKESSSWKNPWQTSYMDELLIEGLLLYQEGPREMEPIKCFYEFESFDVDAIYQSKSVMMSLTELSSIVNKSALTDIKRWEDQSSPEWDRYLSVEDMVLHLEKESDHITDKLYDNKKFDRQSFVKFEFLDSFGEGVKSYPPHQGIARPDLLVLEVATVNEIVCAYWTYEFFWMEIKRFSAELFLNMSRIPINNEKVIEPQWMNSALNKNLEVFYVDSNKIQIESELDCNGSAWDLLGGEISDENICLAMFELPVTFEEANRTVDFDALFKQLSLSHQCTPVLELSDPTCHALYEDLIVMPELALIDSNFTSLPVPKFTEKGNVCVSRVVVCEVLSTCKHSVPGALNFLYLDWHLSQGKPCMKNSCSVLESRIFKGECYKLAQYNLHLDDATFNVNMEEECLLEREPLVSPEINEIKCLTQIEIPVSTTKTSCSVGTKCSILRELPSSTMEENCKLGIESCKQREVHVHTPQQNCSLDSSESVCPLPSSTESNLYGKQCKTSVLPSKSTNNMSRNDSCKESILGDVFACNDLKFFLQARQGTITTPISPGTTLLKGRTDKEQLSITECFPNFQVHKIYLTQKIMTLRGFLELDYSRILRDDENLAVQLQKHKFLLKLSTDNNARETLIMLIKERSDKQEFLNEQQILRAVIALYILQQTAENLCMYGILVGHLYLESWFLNLRFLQDLICLSYSELEEAYKQVEKGFLNDHPKLSSLREIIVKHKSTCKSPKFLIVVERRAVFTMFKQIISCDLRPYQFDREENLLYGGVPLKDQDLFNQAVPDALKKCDCLIVPPEYITSWFPFQHFSCILHYDDFTANEESSLQNVSSRYGLETHAFQIMMKEDDLGAQAGGYSPCSQKGSPISQSGMVLQESLGEGSIKLPNGQNTNTYFTPSIQTNVESEQPHLDASNHAIFGDAIFTGMQLKSYKQCDMNIIVNTSQSYKHLLSSYRSSYDKVLALEKDGACVIERDLFLPIDLILSPTHCLIWYTQDKVYEGKTPSVGKIHLSWVEDIVNDIMRVLSFSFTTCIMIFEGTFEFIKEVIQAFGNLYAAAVGLDIHLQCFISGDSFTTDSLISECIKQVRLSQRRTHFPSMREAKTYAEAFLTEFASVNPLTAHAILSSGMGIRHFMSLSVEEQIHITDAFDLSGKSLNLLKKQWQNDGRSDKNVKESKLGNYESNAGGVPQTPRGLDDQFCGAEEYEINNHAHPNRRTSNLVVKDFSLIKDDLIDDLGEDWEFQKPQENREVSNFEANECHLWHPMVRECPNEKDGNFRNQHPNMILPNKEILRPIVFREQEYRTPSASSEHETKLKRTMDLILKRVTKNEKKSGTKDCFSRVSPNKSFLEVQHHLRPGLEVEDVHGNASLRTGDNILTLDEDGKINSEDMACRMFGFPTDSGHQWVDDVREKPQSVFLSQSVHRKAMRGDAHQYGLEKECGIRQISKECLVEIANERMPLKRRLEFDFPATVKKHQRGGHPTKGKEDLQASLFDKYRYEGEKIEKLGRGYINGGDIEKKIGKKAMIKCEKNKMPNSSISYGWGSQYSKSHSQLMQQQCDEDDEITQIRELCPSWTPHDKRSKKVLSFAKRGNGGQSQLIWQNYCDKRHLT